MSTAPAIELRDVSKTYPTVTAVDGLDLEVPAGQILALLGPNGAGKSTTTEMVLGITAQDAGTVSVFGATPIAAVRRGITGAMLQNGTLLADTTVHRLLRLMHGLHLNPLPLADVIEMADVGAFLKTSTGKLSGGQAQRLRFALAIMGDPRLLLLDEPTVGLDVDSRRRFWQVMGELTRTGRTVVFATHYLDEADEFADRIVVLDHGQVIADGAGADIKARVGGRHVSFTTAQPHDWAGIDGVVAHDVAGHRVTLNTSDSDATLRALLTGPYADDLTGFELVSPSLEDAFVSLTTTVA